MKGVQFDSEYLSSVPFSFHYEMGKKNNKAVTFYFYSSFAFKFFKVNYRQVMENGNAGHKMQQKQIKMNIK